MWRASWPCTCSVGSCSTSRWASRFRCGGCVQHLVCEVDPRVVSRDYGCVSRMILLTGAISEFVCKADLAACTVGRSSRCSQSSSPAAYLRFWNGVRCLGRFGRLKFLSCLFSLTLPLRIVMLPVAAGSRVVGIFLSVVVGFE